VENSKAMETTGDKEDLKKMRKKLNCRKVMKAAAQRYTELSLKQRRSLNVSVFHFKSYITKMSGWLLNNPIDTQSHHYSAELRYR